MFRITLKQLREENKISQQKLANVLKVSQSTVGMWENGKNKPEFDTLIKIADYFNCSVDYLLGKTETKKAPLQMQESLTDEENKLLNYYRELNEEGQYLLIAHAQTLVTSGLYIKNEESSIPLENQA